ncbi:hypothetical protein ASF26_04525 [Methylobacterium sp. Leaf93]|nr:hypothetical protein ASF26_04525 [Methylobacterium sp. Leaf93]
MAAGARHLVVTLDQKAETGADDLAGIRIMPTRDLALDVAFQLMGQGDVAGRRIRHGWTVA